MKPVRYEEVTNGYVAYNESESIVGVLVMVDDKLVYPNKKTSEKRK